MTVSSLSAAQLALAHPVIARSVSFIRGKARTDRSAVPRIPGGPARRRSEVMAGVIAGPYRYPAGGIPCRRSRRGVSSGSLPPGQSADGGLLGWVWRPIPAPTVHVVMQEDPQNTVSSHPDWVSYFIQDPKTGKLGAHDRVPGARRQQDRHDDLSATTAARRCATTCGVASPARSATSRSRTASRSRS